MHRFAKNLDDISIPTATSYTAFDQLSIRAVHLAAPTCPSKTSTPIVSRLFELCEYALGMRQCLAALRLHRDPIDIDVMIAD